ncbi:WXG100 family type VII secretion target [Nocardioides pantholopis]|uniref:WXG100 family type VII secretion target n=1 Tax=Nocardioides pantholopis TaxID=2483798 RepID=UPI0013DDF35A|nr:WXG100 family type VII secretion target [Nocardioides pantholopis]
MTHGSSEYGQGEQALSKAATLVADAKRDFDALATQLDGQISGLRGRWVGQGAASFFTLHQAWTEKQRTIVRALDEFEAALLTTERDNTTTDDTQSANYTRTAGRLGGS